MTKIIQIRVDDDVKSEVEALFESLGLDTATAVRMFFMASLEERGLPFSVRTRRPSAEMLQALDDVRNNRDIRGPFRSAKDAIEYALREDV